MLARWIATVAALLLACANPHASAHVRAERMGDLINRTEHSATAHPGELARNPKTAPPARARLADLAPGKNAAPSHCHVRQKSLSQQNRTSGVAVYTWDAEGRLTGAVLGNGPTQKTTAYRYDPNGIRRSQVVTDAAGSTRTEYLVDPNQAYAQVLEEWSATAAAGPLPDATLGTTYVYGDDLISQTKLALAGSAATSVYHYDGLGTTRALSAYKVDAAGAPQAGHGEITDRYAYTAFGESDPAGTSGDTSGSSENNYRYTGEQLDPNLGFYYLRARYMDPSRGRLIGMDRFEGSSMDPHTLHKYLYASADPINRIDPSGHVSLAGALVVLNGIGIGVNVATYAFNIATGNVAGLAAQVAEDAVAMLIPGGTLVKNGKQLGGLLRVVRGNGFRWGVEHSSAALAVNLRLIKAPKSCTACQAHHIVPGGEQFQSALDARNLLQHHNIDINSFMNGVWLDATAHHGRHLRAYSDQIWIRLQQANAAGGKPSVYAELVTLQKELQAGLWNHLL
jgi:RHS repeat-associated protein